MDYLGRLKKLADKLPSIGCDTLLVEHPIHLLYLTGLELSAGKLLVSSQGGTLFVDGRYIETALKQSPCPVFLIDQWPLKEWLIANNTKSLAFESDKTSYQAFLNLKKMAEELNKEGKPLALIPVESPVQELRLIKDADEIYLLQQAAQLGREGYEFVVAHLLEGVVEAELALELEYFWRKKGAKKAAFDPIIAFGSNSSMPHYRAGQTRLQNGMPVLIDIGVTLKNYHSDMTRVVFFGKVDSQMQEIYTIVEEAKQRALTLCKPGTRVGELDCAARDYITAKGYGENFTHSLGHGLGLDVHEAPTIRAKGPFAQLTLEPGMVITIEPGIYLPGKGGVRLEDTVLITSNGYKNLTGS